MQTCNDCACDLVCNHNEYGFENCGNWISKNAVPVVRCKDCKYRPDETREINACPMWDNGDNGWGSHWNGEDNGFCYVGERKDGDDR